MADDDNSEDDKHKNSDNPDKTGLAEDRTILANERTFSSRMGLALGSLGLAVGLQGVFGETQPTWIAKLAASIFVLIAILVAVGGYKNSEKMLKRLHTYRSEPASTLSMFIVASLIATGSLVIGIILWMI